MVVFLAAAFSDFLPFTLTGVAIIVALAGLSFKRGLLGVLVDGRGRYSLNHTQIVMWTVLIISTWMAVLLSEGPESRHLQISAELLGLMGVSLGTGVISAVVKASKETPAAMAVRASAARHQQEIVVFDASGGSSGVRPLPTPVPAGVARVAITSFPVVLSSGALRSDGPIQPHLRQVVAQEEGDLADQVIDVTKFQNLLLTFIAGGMFVFLAVKSGGLPKPSENLVWLLGISHAGYVAAKVPNRS